MNNQYGNPGGGQYQPQQQPQYQQPYPQPPGQYPQHPGAYPPPPGGYPQPGPRGPSRGLGVIKVLFGLGLSASVLVWLAVDGHEGIAGAAVLGVILGFGLRWVVTGGANVAGKKVKLLPSLLVVPVGLLIGAGAGPSISEAYWKHEEETLWVELTSGDLEHVWGYRWEYEYFYDLPVKFHRPEAAGARRYAEVRDAIREDNLIELRDYIYDIRINHEGDANYDMALQAATAALQTKYDAVLANLAKPGVAGSEFEVDEDLRKAFQLIVTDLAGAPTPDVYVVFSNQSDLTPPEGHEKNLAEMKEEASVKRGFPDGNVRIIDPGSAFSPAYDAARRAAFLEVAEAAFRRVLQAQLLTLKPLNDGEKRDGRFVLEVSSEIMRTSTYFNFYETNAAKQEVSKGLLFGIAVLWEFKLFGRDGKLLYETSTYSVPGANLFVNTQPGDPEWAVHSILMDSAYYNYSREVIGNFGLIPPPEKKEYDYRNYGVKTD